MSLPLRVAHTPLNSTRTYLGTILYSGPVPPTKGEWYGVEWDDATRGKHDGVHDATGIRYFSCRVPGAGSFIRPSAPGLSLGTSFPRALREKYAPESTTANAKAEADHSIFYGTASNFEIEVTSLAKIKDTFRNLGRLKEAGLEWEGVSSAGDPQERDGFVQQLKQLRVLNLSFSLVPTLEIVAEIVEGMAKLRILALNSNRFRVLKSPTILPAFSQLTELQLNKTLVTWAEIVLLSASLPSLDTLQLGTNALQSLDSPPLAPANPFPLLKTLNLAENALSRWNLIASSLSPLPRLSRLILSSNALTELTPSTAPLTTLRHLSISHNDLSSWTSIDALTEFPALDSLAIEGCDFGLSPERRDEVRMGAIARVAKLVELDGSVITPIEREDAELFYLLLIAKERAAASVEELEQRHPRWRELLAHYGETPTSAAAFPPPPKKDTIKSKLLHLTIKTPSATFALAALPTLPTRVLRTQIAKKAGIPLLKGKWKLVAVLRPSEEGGESPLVEVPEGEEGREVGWWGLGEGDEVRVVER